MRRILGLLLLGLCWGLAACLSVLEVLTAWAWLRGTLYVMDYGRAENPYAAEDADIAGVCALALLPLALAALAWAVYGTILRCKNRAKKPGRRDRGEQYADDLLRLAGHEGTAEGDRG